jgi:signal transduction histidine kinase
LWVGTAGGGIDHVQGTSVTHPFRAAGVPVSTVISVYEDPHGIVWAGTTQGLGRIVGGRFEKILAEGGRQLDRVFAIAGNRQGKVWAADSGLGLFEISSGRAVAINIPGVAPGMQLYSLYSDTQDRLWVGFYEGGLTMLAEETWLAPYTPAAGLAKGPVESIFEDRAGNIWVGTGEGLSRLRGGRWTTWTSAHGLAPSSAQAIAETRDPAQLWLESGAGMIRLDLHELDSTPNGAPQPLKISTHGVPDGIHFSDNRKLPLPRLAQYSSVGRIAIATEDGLALLDARRIPMETVPPQVAIERVLVNGKPISAAAGELAIREHNIEIEFAAIELGLAEGIRFRYRLEGFDRQWSEPTTSSRIVYGQLPTGRFRFRVSVVDERGAASGSGASLAFRCQPYLYETWPFIIFCVAAALVMYGLHWFRLRRVRLQFGLILKERTRVARELHDTLLQGFAGVVFLLNAAARQFDTAPEKCRKSLEHAIDQSEQSLREARQALSSMRLSLLEDHTLPEALAQAGKQIVTGVPIRFHLEVKGQHRQLPYETDANLFIIGREAINNSMAHASPASIHVTLQYERETVRLLVHDDGCGFDPYAPVERNHWGIQGMRERANQIGGNLILTSKPGHGTTIEVNARTRMRKTAIA